MRISPLFIVILALLATAPAGNAGADTETLTGEYQSRWGDGDLKAEFTAAGRDTWKVAFDFRFDGVRHFYRGTARGSLSSGRLAGDVKTANGRRSFSFDGTVTQGRFRGDHYETTGGGSQRTGTLTLHR